MLRCRPPLALRAPVTDPRALRVVVLALHRLRDPRATSAAWFPAALEHPVVLALAGAARRGLLPVHLVGLQQPVRASYDGCDVTHVRYRKPHPSLAVHLAQPTTKELALCSIVG